jgi:chemotaxis protein MotB
MLTCDTKKGWFMFKGFSSVFCLFLIAFLTFSLTGCTFIFQKGRRGDVDRISKLKNEVGTLQSQLTELEQAKKQLEDRLQKEIADKDVQVNMARGGLVITFVAEVLYGSGKADLRESSYDALGKVSQVLTETVPDLAVGVEGHTDNEPIKKSGWRSNWELSTARALEVVHYLQEVKGIDPARLSATGYGEYKPVAPNDSKENMQKNRRVEIVILPKATVKGR